MNRSVRLDVSVQAQVLNLLLDLQQRFGMTYLLISHDLAVVNHLCEEVIVMQQGNVVERGSPKQLFNHAHHPYHAKAAERRAPDCPGPCAGTAPAARESQL